MAAPTVTKVGDYFSSGQKIFSAIAALIVVIYTVSVAFYRLDQMSRQFEQFDTNQKAIYQELQKDWKAQFDDQHELIIKNIQSINAVKQAFNDHEISAAEFRGRVKQILKIQ